ncbi:energy transducer TonB [Noviherbaspirillum sp.]|uniref:energy transducer TonB n=1 Tax=Noviherbaspirillum sp. TaxID=1926288 RepID=UPI002FE1BDC2
MIRFSFLELPVFDSAQRHNWSKIVVLNFFVKRQAGLLALASSLSFHALFVGGIFSLLGNRVEVGSERVMNVSLLKSEAEGNRPDSSVNAAPQTEVRHDGRAFPKNQATTRIFSEPTSVQSIPQVAEPEHPHYFSSKELTQKPRIVQEDPATKRFQIHGVPSQTAVVRLFIDEVGQVVRAQVEESLLPADVEELIVNAFLSAKFLPGELQGRSVKSQIRIAVDIEPNF